MDKPPPFDLVKEYMNAENKIYNQAIDDAIESVKNTKLPEEGFTYLPDLKNLIAIRLNQLKKPS